jgi:lipid-A-disaccharide synthase
MKRMGYQPWVGLPNILLGEFAVPELLQGEATPQKLAQAAFNWLDNPQASLALGQRFDALHHQLRCNTAQAATDVIQKILNA